MPDDAAEQGGGEPEPAADGGVSGKLVVTIGLALLVGVLAFSFIGARVVPGFIERRKLALRLGCADNLRGLGLAALQYAEDHGWFPHAGPLDALDGGPETSDTPRVWRMLVAAGYADDPERFVCPAAPPPRSPPAVQEAHWAWLMGEAELEQPPSLIEFDRLSYGWTRRPLALGASGDLPLAADKAVAALRGPVGPVPGNHTEGWNVLRVDARVDWLSVHDEPFPGEYLAAIDDPARDGFLAIGDQDDPTPFR